MLKHRAAIKADASGFDTPSIHGQAVRVNRNVSGFLFWKGDAMKRVSKKEKLFCGKTLDELKSETRQLQSESRALAQEILTRQEFDFFSNNVGLPFFHQNDVYTTVREDKDTCALVAVICVGGMARRQDVCAAIPSALEWRDCLLEWEGRTLGQRLAKTLTTMSYEKLAQALNTAIHDSLSKVVELEKREAQDKDRTAGGLFLAMSWQARNRARDMLLSMNIPGDRAELLIEKGLENIRKGDPAFETDKPFSKENIARKRQYYGKSKKPRRRQKLVSSQ